MFGQIECQQDAGHVDDRADPQHPWVTDMGNPGDGEAERRYRGASRDVHQGDPGVDFHEGQLRGHDAGDHRAAGHPEPTGEHEQAEREGVDGHPMLEGTGELPGKHAAGQADRGQRGAAAVGEPVQHRADHRRQQGERHHGDQ